MPDVYEARSSAVFDARLFSALARPEPVLDATPAAPAPVTSPPLELTFAPLEREPPETVMLGSIDVPSNCGTGFDGDRAARQTPRSALNGLARANRNVGACDSGPDHNIFFGDNVEATIRRNAASHVVHHDLTRLWIEAQGRILEFLPDSRVHGAGTAIESD